MTAPRRSPRPPFDGPDVAYAVLEASPHNVVAIDAAGVIGYANARALQTFGYAAEELLGRSADVLVPAEHRARHRRVRQAFVEAPRPRPMPGGRWLEGQRRDGTRFPVEMSLTPITGEDGLWVIAAIADVTARRAAEARERSLSRAYLTLARVNQAMVRAGSAQELFAETCRVAVEEGGYLGAWVARPGPGHTIGSVTSAGALDDYIARLDLTSDPDDPRGRGPTALALREGRPCYTADFLAAAATAPWHDLAAGFGIRASATLPLRRGGRTVAVLTLWSGQPDIFDEQMRGLLEGMAENVSFALEGFDAAERLQRVAAQRSALLSRVVAAQEEERARIAADVHDDSVQALAAVDLRLGLLRRRVEHAAPGVVEAVAQLQETVGSVTAGLRRLLVELEPAPVGARLPELLREAAATVFEHTDVRWSVDVDPGPPPGWDAEAPWLADEVRVQALRVVREALINVRKHAGARVVSIEIRPEEDWVEVVVSDDGVGIALDDLAPVPGHRGLATMRDRATIAGGWCRIERGAVGTVLRLWLPREPLATAS